MKVVPEALLLFFFPFITAAILDLSEIPQDCLDAVMRKVYDDSLRWTRSVCKSFRSSCLRICYNKHRDTFLRAPGRSVFFPCIEKAKSPARMAVLGLKYDTTLSPAEKIKGIAMIISSSCLSAALLELINLFFGYFITEDDKLLFKAELDLCLGKIDPYHWNSKALRRWALDSDSKFFIFYHIPLLLLDYHPDKITVLRQAVVRIISYRGMLDGSTTLKSYESYLYNSNGVLWALKKSGFTVEEARDALLPVADMIRHFCGRDRLANLRIFCDENLGMNPVADYDEQTYKTRMAQPDNVFMAMIALDESKIWSRDVFDRLEDPLIVETLMPFHEFEQNILKGKPQSIAEFSSTKIQALQFFLRFKYNKKHDKIYSAYFWTIGDEETAENYVRFYETVRYSCVSDKLDRISESTDICPDLFPRVLWNSINTILYRDTRGKRLLNNRMKRELQSAVERKDFKVLQKYDLMMRECDGFKKVFNHVMSCDLISGKYFSGTELAYFSFHMLSAGQN